MKGLCTNVAMLSGGVAFNVVPERAELEWSIRPYPGFDRAAWDRAIVTRAREIDPAIAIEATIDHAPFRTRDGAPLVDAVRAHARALAPVDFWTEAALWAAHGADAVVIGPGDIAQAHAGDEFVALADLDWAVELYASLLAA
jgi:acetylornithine deacetylase